MTILTPKQLWLSYNRFTPTEVSVINSENENEKRLYFNGYKTENSVVRVYARLSLCKSEAKAPVLVIAHSFFEDIDLIDAQPFLDLGYSVLFVDYAGKNNISKAHYTHYPKNLNAEWETDYSVLKKPTDDIKNSCWYYFTSCIIHAVTFLETCDLVDSKNIGIIGIDDGAGLVYKCSVLLNEIKAGMSFFCSDIIDTQNEEYLSYKVALDSRACALDSFPVLINATTNEFNGGFDYLSELHLNAKNSLFSVYPKANKAISPFQTQNIKTWFDSFFSGNSIQIEKPIINLFCSEGVLYAELTTSGENVNIFVSFSDNPAFRNWNRLKFSKAGENKYLAKIDVFDVNSNVYVFANVLVNGLTISTPLVAKNPIKLGINDEEKLTKSRLLYQSDNNEDCFMAEDCKIFLGKNVEVREGPLGLSGVYGDCLVTYKPNEKRFRASLDSLLQIILYSPLSQEVDFSIASLNGELKEFNAKRRIIGGSWTTITLSDEDFKCLLGSPTFDKVIKISVKGKEIIINSIIWV